MNKQQDGVEVARKPDLNYEGEHEKNRRIKSEQERILRKQLCHLRRVELDEIEAEIARPRRFKD